MLKQEIRQYFLIVIFLLLLLGFTSCLRSNLNNNNQYSERVITDMLDREVVIPERITKIVAVNPGALRLMVYMDLTKSISGVEDIEKRPGRAYAMANPSLTKKEIIGPAMGGDPELITFNNPDIIFTTFSTKGEADDLEAQTGIPVVGLNTGDFYTNRKTFYNSLNIIGEVTGRSKRADSIIAFIKREINELQKINSKSSSNKKSIYIGGVSYSGARGLTSTVPKYESFEFINAKNVAANLTSLKNNPSNTASTIDLEQLILWNPNYLFIDAAGLSLTKPQIKRETPAGKTLQAIENNSIHTLMPYNWYSTNFETILANSWFAASVLHPDIVSQKKFEKRIRNIFNVMLGKDVSKELKEMYQGWINITKE
ncbi:ABC transporter substrate-binding protein [Marinilabiliaceae bacterium ANBcel2]|nr:ABC transporter substrate-binding protein [Marinilabiliaceae bacterium ANBcel2]